MSLVVLPGTPGPGQDPLLQYSLQHRLNKSEVGKTSPDRSGLSNSGAKP